MKTGNLVKASMVVKSHLEDAVIEQHQKGVSITDRLSFITFLIRKLEGDLNHYIDPDEWYEVFLVGSNSALPKYDKFGAKVEVPPAPLSEPEKESLFGRVNELRKELELSEYSSCKIISIDGYYKNHLMKWLNAQVADNRYPNCYKIFLKGYQAEVSFLEDEQQNKKLAITKDEHKQYICIMFVGSPENGYRSKLHQKLLTRFRNSMLPCGVVVYESIKEYMDIYGAGRCDSAFKISENILEELETIVFG